MKIAIIGSSSSLFDKEKGKEIDSHDLVIRCNHAIFNSDTSYTGIKTDVWAYGFNVDMEKDIKKIKNVKEIWGLTRRRSYRRFKRIKNKLEKITNKIKLVELKDYFTYKSIIEKEPTTGLLTIIMAKKLFPEADINLYGFSLEEEEDDENIFTCGIVWDKFHSLEEERKLIKTMEKVFHR